MSIESAVIYSSVRQEILDQKKCQFQLVATSLSITSAILAYGAARALFPLVFVAPILLNVFSLAIILDKALSIQRMVGYLQLIEIDSKNRTWMWEFHLNIFRECPERKCGPEPYRKHTYVFHIAIIMILLNLIASGLYGWGPGAVQIQNADNYSELAEVYGAIHLIVISLNIYAISVAIRRWWQLINGGYTNAAIRQRWEETLTIADQQIIDQQNNRE